MIDPDTATKIMVGFLIVMGIIIPVCGVIPKVREVISLRYLIVVVFLAASLGVIIDFAELDTSIRATVLVSTAILSGAFILLRSIEKAFYNRWIGNGKIEASLEKGDLHAKLKVTPETPKATPEKDTEGLQKLAERENQ